MMIYVRKDEVHKELDDFYLPCRIALVTEMADLVRLRDHLNACISEMSEWPLEGRHMLGVGEEPTESNVDIIVVCEVE